MSWLHHHRISEQLAASAEAASRRGDVPGARSLYAQAAEAEQRALAVVEATKPRTLGICAVSAVSLYCKAAQFKMAELLSHQWLASEHLPGFAAEQLRRLLHSIWSEQVREHADVDFAPGQVIVSVRGGKIVEGGAPLDLIVGKMKHVEALFYRTVEYQRNVPYRKHGRPGKDILETCRPWLFHTAPGSYQFAVAVQEPRQQRWFDNDAPRPREIADQFLNILRASAEAPEDELPALVPHDEYRRTFLELTRHLAPTGKRFEQLEIRSESGPQSVTLVPSTRATVLQVIRATKAARHTDEAQEESIRGVLRAVHLNKDWIVVTTAQRDQHIFGLGDAVDDVIGPMVNNEVVVQVTRDEGGKLLFCDIEMDE